MIDLDENTCYAATQRGRAAIYARVEPGTRRQTPQPLNTLVELANEQGYTNEQIIVYEDVGVSAGQPLARRGALSDLLTAITQEGQEKRQEPIKAIYVSSEDRLFKDANTIDLTYFISLCANHGIQLRTPSTTYDFTAPDQAALFRFRCDQAAHYIAEQIGRLTQRSRARRPMGQKPAEE